MSSSIKDIIAKFAIDKLEKSSLGDMAVQGQRIFDTLYKNVSALIEKQGEEAENLVKAITVMTFSILNKISTGKTPSDITKDDWKDILSDISEYAILQDEQKYVEFVFALYNRYIRFYILVLEDYVSEEKLKKVLVLADELEEKTRLLEAGELEEVKYIEDCLWISLEAIIKLLAIRSTSNMQEEYAELVQALSMYAFEYGRFILYKKEQAILNEYIQAQYKLDRELQEKYNVYIKELEEQSNQFFILIDNAFAPDFRDNFLHSIVLAKAVGVDENELLMNVDDVDEFFS